MNATAGILGHYAYAREEMIATPARPDVVMPVPTLILAKNLKKLKRTNKESLPGKMKYFIIEIEPQPK